LHVLPCHASLLVLQQALRESGERMVQRAAAAVLGERAVVRG
jgi:hypothetical protein